MRTPTLPSLPRYLLALACVLAVLPWAAPAAAEEWPTKPLRLMVGFPPGGGLDFFARTLAQKLQEQLGQPVVVENRSGANGTLATDAVSKAAPDGYTLLISNEAQMVINQHLYPNAPADPLASLAPITQAAYVQVILYVHPTLGVNSVADFVKLARAKPGTINYASVGAGGVFHLTGELFKSVAKVDIVHVPYKGGGPASVAMLSGEVQAGFAGYSSLANARAGKLKALATTGNARGAATPDIPTFSEAGFPEVNLVGWFGLLAPAGTPKDIVTRLNSEIVKALRTPEIKEKLGGQGIEVIAGTPEQFTKVITTEIPVYSRLVKEAKVRIE